MYTFFADDKNSGFFSITSPEELKHFRVRRIRVGEKVNLIWEGELYTAEVVKAEEGKVLCKPLEKTASRKPSIRLYVLQAVPVDLSAFEEVVRICTELGVSDIYPLITERSFRKRDVLIKKLPRWERISKESMKQCKRPWFMKIHEPVKLESLSPPAELNLFLDSFGEEKAIGDLDFKGGSSLSLLVGPEGGFSEREGKLIKEKGFIPVKLEPYTLRVQTAVAVSAGLIVNLA